jgi:hypothetical protein
LGLRVNYNYSKRSIILYGNGRDIMQKKNETKTSETRGIKPLPAVEDIKRTSQGNGRTQQSQQKAGGAEAGQTDGANVDKIREILFGSQTREFDGRMSHLEQNFLETTSELRQSSMKRLETLENYFKKQLETLVVSQKSEREERTDAVKKLMQEMKQADESLAKKIDQLSDQAVAAQRELRAEILKQSKELRDEIAKLQAELCLALERKFQELNQSKTDRAALAAILTEMAMRISGELHLPAAED